MLWQAVTALLMSSGMGIYDVTVSKDYKRLYTATTMGLCCYDIENKSWTKTFGRNILLWGTPIRTVCEITAADRRNGRKGKTGKTGDDDVEIWFGTNDGLYIYNINTRKLMHMTVADGLSSEGIAAIQSDKRGAVWVSTIHGLNRIDATTRKVTNRYYVEDGLQGNEFSDGAAALSADGTLVFGGVSGITYFTPTAFNGKTWRANILLTDFKVNGRSITAGEKSGRYVITDVTPILSDKFDLYSEDNNITLQFSTMTYEACEHITYHYRINSAAWIELPAGTTRFPCPICQQATISSQSMQRRTGSGRQRRLSGYAFTLHGMPRRGPTPLSPCGGGWHSLFPEQPPSEAAPADEAKDGGDGKSPC